MNPPKIEPIEVTVARIETIVTDMHDRLFGNGQPGVIEKHDEKIGELQKSASFFKGAIAIIGFLLTVTGSALAAHLLSNH